MYNDREFQKTYISTSTSTTVFTGRGTLGGVSVNTAATGAILLLDGGTQFASLKSSISEGTYLSDLVISNGLIISTAGTPDITVKWCRA